jgi:predicted kinase
MRVYDPAADPRHDPSSNEVVVHVMHGLPGSGKSTFARSIPAMRFNLDDYRRMMSIPRWDDTIEKVVQKAMLRGVVSAVEAGYDVVIDNTHMGYKLPNRYRTMLSTRNVVFRVHDLMADMTIEECIAADAARREGERVGESVIRGMWDRHNAARKDGWKLTDEWMNEWRDLIRPIQPFVIDDSLPWCVLFDIDGTLAKHTDRGPYDLEELETDNLNEPVANLADIYPVMDNDMRVILLSGRQEEYRKQTENWLNAHGIKHDELFMRPTGDRRPDFVVKSQLFEQHIRGIYNVEAVYDDRNQVVDLWRLVYKLPCMQVDYGDF